MTAKEIYIYFLSEDERILAYSLPERPHTENFSFWENSFILRKFQKGVRLHQIGEVAGAVSFQRCGQHLSLRIHAQAYLQKVLQRRLECDVRG